MNRVITTIVSMFASLVVLNGALAQQQRAVRVVIPFDFSASGTQLPAGAYTIATQNGFTSVTKNGTGEFTFVSAMPAGDNLSGNSKLVFSTYGNQHFLRKIVCPEFGMNLELLPSKSEMKARLQTANQTAGNAGR